MPLIDKKSIDSSGVCSAFVPGPRVQVAGMDGVLEADSHLHQQYTLPSSQARCAAK